MARVTFDGVPARRLAERWGVPEVGVFRSLPSTLDAIHDLGAQDAPRGTLVLAEEQTAGRGRQGHVWHSPRGGLWLGLLARPKRASLGALPVRLGLVLAEALDAIVTRRVVELKWPNDLLVGDRKIGGILCEARWQGDRPQWVAIGIGLNVANPIPPDIRPRAVALAELVPGIRRIDVLDQAMPALLPAISAVPPLTEAECEAYAPRDWLRGRQLAAPLFGIARGIRPDGALLLEVQGTTTVVREGHVELA